MALFGAPTTWLTCNAFLAKAWTAFARAGSLVFPQYPGIINGQLSHSFNESIFHMGKMTVEHDIKKRLKLKINEVSLPYIVWSTGQKEFMPLLLGFYWLCPPDKFRRNDLTTVIIEEPEIGLHPEAIKSFLLQIIDLLRTGYKVIVSTHSPVLLEFAWAFNFLKGRMPMTAPCLSCLDWQKRLKMKNWFPGF